MEGEKTVIQVLSRYNKSLVWNILSMAKKPDTICEVEFILYRVFLLTSCRQEKV